MNQTKTLTLRVLLLVALMMMSMAVLSGCNKKLDQTELAFVDPLMDDLFSAIANRDYNLFSTNFSETMKAAYSEEAFLEMVDKFTDEYGQLEEKHFSNAQFVSSNGMKLIEVVYLGEFSRQNNVIITLYLNGNITRQLIEGFSINVLSEAGQQE